MTTNSCCPILVALLLAAAGCRGVSVDSTYDPTADFGRLRTYDWLSVPPQARTAVQDVSLIDLIRLEIERHGLQRRQADPDLLVAVHRSLEGNLNTKGWGYETQGGRLRHYTLQEGTLVVDLVDAKTKRTVWRGSAEGVFKFDEDPAQQRQMIEELLREMFADFPPGG
jgi:hypothetical protein